MSSVWWITELAKRVYPSHGAIPTGLNPRRSAGTERFLGEEIAQRCVPERS